MGCKSPKTYPRNWPAYNQAKMREGSEFPRLLAALCQGAEVPRSSTGRPPVPCSVILFSAIMKSYLQTSGRVTTSELRRMVDDGFLSAAPHYNTISEHMAKPEMVGVFRGLLHRSSDPFAPIEREFAPDATGFTTGTYDRWVDEVRGKPTKRRRERWLKAHAICGVETHTVTDLVVTHGAAHDGTQFPVLLAATARRFEVDAVLADAGYSSRSSLDAIEKVGATPFIPFPSGSTGEGGGAWSKAWAFFVLHRDEFEARFHMRSNVETVFSVVKRRFGSRLWSKTYVAQVNELYAKFIAHNLCVLIAAVHELGLEEDFWAPVFGRAPEVRSP